MQATTTLSMSPFRRLIGLFYRLRWLVTRLYAQPAGYLATWWGPLAVDARDSVSPYLKRYGVYEESLSLDLLHTIQRGMTVLNIGANIGYLAIVAARRAKVVYAFEPDPRSFALLERNKGRNIVPINAAVGDQPGTASLWLDQRSFGNTSRARENTDEAKPTTVPMVSIDSFLAETGEQADVIVMDVQGGEASVLRGMRNTLRTRPVIFFELWPFGLKNCGANADEIRDIFHAAGYRLEHIASGLPNPETQWRELLEQLHAMKRGRGFCNLKAVPNDRL